MAKPERAWTPGTAITSSHALSMGANLGFGSIGCAVQIDQDKCYVTTAAHALPLRDTASKPQIFSSSRWVDADGLSAPPLAKQPCGTELARTFDLVFVEATVPIATFDRGAPSVAAVVPKTNTSVKFFGARERNWGTARVAAEDARLMRDVFVPSALDGYDLSLFIVVRFDEPRDPDSYEGDSGSMFWFEDGGKLFPVGHLVVVSREGERFGLVGVFDRALAMSRVVLS